MPAAPVAGKGRRPYRSVQRSAQAQQTRERLIAAATEQFVRVGYGSTTVPSVAAAAGVSVPTVERVFGSKAALLRAAIDVAIAGDHAQVAVLDRDWVRRAREATGAAEFLAVVAATVRPAMSRSAGLVLAAFQAAAADEALHDLAEQLSRQRARTVAWIVDGVRERAALRPDLTRRRAIDEVWLLMDPAVYERLTRYRGWSPARYEQWFVETVLRLLLD